MNHPRWLVSTHFEHISVTIVETYVPDHHEEPGGIIQRFVDALVSSVIGRDRYRRIVHVHLACDVNGVRVYGRELHRYLFACCVFYGDFQGHGA